MTAARRRELREAVDRAQRRRRELDGRLLRLGDLTGYRRRSDGKTQA